MWLRRCERVELPLRKAFGGLFNVGGGLLLRTRSLNAHALAVPLNTNASVEDDFAVPMA